MTGQTFHIAQGKHNKNFLAKIVNTNFFDWSATVMFYTALQYTDFYFDMLLKRHPESHADRARLLVENGTQFSKKFYKSYRNLENMSMIARYKPDTWQKIITQSMITTLEEDLDIVMGRK